ncbi:MAG: hypothetical protein QOF48_2373 [Verrucomicrobiota bacterium]|jgi:predicted NUDIX family NTP pyrophosphohydrolase
MSARISAGLVMYRIRAGSLEVFLAHPGGPLFAKKDDGHWTIPKGEVEPGDELLATALREFEEEIGHAIDPASRFIPLGSIRQKGGKIVHAWGVEGDRDDARAIVSNHFEMEWPPRSGRMSQFPEVDRARFFSLSEAKRKVKETQRPLLDELARLLDITGPPASPAR